MRHAKCEECGTEFKTYKTTQRFCSFKCRCKSQEVKVDPAQVIRMYQDGMTIYKIAETLKVGSTGVWSTLRRNGVELRKNWDYRRGMTGPSMSQWKGEKAGYIALHERVYDVRGQPKQCERCGTTEESKKYDWANLTGNYSDPKDYARLCRKCHVRMDKDRRKTTGLRTTPQKYWERRDA